MAEENVVLTKAELQAIVDEASKKAMQQTMLLLGIDIEKPIEAQKDFAYLRQLREGSSSSRMGIIIAVIGSGVTAVGTLLFMGAKQIFGGGNVPGG